MPKKITKTLFLKEEGVEGLLTGSFMIRFGSYIVEPSFAKRFLALKKRSLTIFDLLIACITIS
jgi:hypothetical protein